MFVYFMFSLLLNWFFLSLVRKFDIFRSRVFYVGVFYYGKFFFIIICLLKGCVEFFVFSSCL